MQLIKKSTQNILQKVTYDLRHITFNFTLDLSSLDNAARYYQRERGAMKHASEIFPEALKQLLEIGEKGMKQREKRERAKHVTRPRETRACKHGACKEKQLKLKLTTTL